MKLLRLLAAGILMLSAMTGFAQNTRTVSGTDDET